MEKLIAPQEEFDRMQEVEDNLTLEEIDATKYEGSKLRQFQYGLDKSSWFIGDLHRKATAAIKGIDVKELQREENARLARRYDDLPLRSKKSMLAKVGEGTGEILDLSYAVPGLGGIGATAKTASFAAKAFGRAKQGAAIGSLVAADEALNASINNREIGANEVALYFSLGAIPAYILGPTRKAVKDLPSDETPTVPPKQSVDADDEALDNLEALPEGSEASRPETIEFQDGTKKDLEPINSSEVTPDEAATIRQFFEQADAEDSPLVAALYNIPVFGKRIKEARAAKQDFNELKERVAALITNEDAVRASTSQIDELEELAKMDEALRNLEDDVWFVPKQEFTSKNTVVNYNKFPALITKLRKDGTFKEGDRVLDIGGGAGKDGGATKAETVYTEEGVEYLVYDPFNRTAEHNIEVAGKVKGGQVDGVINANVLNTIKEESNQSLVIKQAHDALKDGKQAFFSVYAGVKGKAPGPSSKKDPTSWQNNKPLEDYMPLIESVFGKGNVQRKGNTIIATKDSTFIPDNISTIIDDSVPTNVINGREVFKNPKGTSYKRGDKTNPVGKIIGNQIYFHKNYIEQMPKTLQNLYNKAIKELPEDASFNTLMYEKAQKGKPARIRFDEAPDFDTATEPRVGKTWSYTAKGGMKKGKASNSIWHHKWMWVGEDYTGFNVDESYNWSKTWTSTLNASPKSQPAAWTKQLEDAGISFPGVDEIETPTISASSVTLNTTAPIKKDHPRVLKYIENNYPEALEAAAEADKTIDDLVKEYHEAGDSLTNGYLNIIEGLDSDNILNGNTFARAITRPLIGAATGYSIGVTNNFITEDDSVSPAVFALLGAASGQLSKKIINSDMSTASKEISLQGIKDLQRRNLWANVNLAFAGSHSSAMKVLGGVVNDFNKQLFAQKGFNLKGTAAPSVEETVSNVIQQHWLAIDKATIAHQLNGEDMLPLRMLATDYANGFIFKKDLKNKVKQGELSATQMQQVISYGDWAKKYSNDYFTDAIDNAGLEGKKLLNYGLSHIYDVDEILKNPELAKQAFTKAYLKQGVTAKTGMSAEEVARAKADTIVENFATYGKPSAGNNKSWEVGSKADYTDPDLVMVDLAANVERDRTFKAPGARKEIKDFLVRDPAVLLKKYVENNTDKIEFSRRFGSKGEGITSIKRAIVAEYDPLIKVATEANDYNKVDFLKKQRNRKIKAIHDSVDLFFGKLHAADEYSNNTIVNNFYSIVSTMANLTFLPKATISSLGDIIQPFQNSGAFSAIKGLGRAIKTDREKDFASLSGFDTRDITVEELRQYFTIDKPHSRTQRYTRKVNEKFFKTIGLTQLTTFARRYAYNAGIEDAFNLSKKISKKPSSSLISQAEQYKMTADMAKYLSGFDNVDAAFADPSGKELLNRMGIRAADRDALIPQLSNRRAFAQSRNPHIKSLAQFMSWAMAKTSQLNALVKRIEDGDTALAVRALGTLVLYDGILTFRDFLNDPTMESESNKDYDSFAEKMVSSEQFARVVPYSGNVNWLVDKTSRLWSGASYRQSLDSISPVYAWLGEMATGTTYAAQNLAEGDFEGAAHQYIIRAPFGKEAKALAEGMDWEFTEDRPSGRAEGGLIKSRLQKAQGGRSDHPSMFRLDGTRKDEHGFLGPMTNSRGEIMTEFSTTIEMDGKKFLIPTLVPGQTEEALEYMRNMEGGQGFNTKIPIEKQIVDTAAKHAMPFIKAGLSPFYKHGEEKVKVKKDKGGLALVPNAPVEPDERIDKMTGRPYSEQAGGAFIDIEDRQGLVVSALGKKLQGQASV
tara:strand:- start:70 stop:5418 length:5349 start_codon:yes stop_codon:yes gene_type:complete